MEYPKTGRGFVEPAGDVFIPTPAALEEDAVIALAGPFAQRRFAPRSHWRLTAGYQGEINGREIFAPPGSDLSIFWSDIGALVDHGRQREAIVEKIEARTLALVKERWQEIRLIAAALLERKTLTERAVYRLLKRPLPKRAPRCSVIVICSVLVVC